MTHYFYKDYNGNSYCAYALKTHVPTEFDASNFLGALVLSGQGRTG